MVNRYSVPVEHLFEAVIACSHSSKYQSSANEFRPYALDAELSKIVSATSSLSCSARIEPDEVFNSFITTSLAMIAGENTAPSTRSKFLLVLFNLCHYNIPLRRSLCKDERIINFVIKSLHKSIAEKLGPQNLIDILRLIQMLTYEKTLPMNDWTDDLTDFTIEQILRTSESEWMPYALAILSNLVSNSSSVKNRIRLLNYFPALCAKLCSFLSHKSRVVVVSSLNLLEFLDDKAYSTIFSPQNIAQVFLCIFNVISSTDFFMTIQVAVKLLKRLAISESGTTLSQIGSDIASYNFFEKSLRKVGNLLATLDPCSEESFMVYDLFLSFCQVNDLRKPLCSTLLQIRPTETRLTTPCNSICRTATLTIEHAIFPEVPFYGIKLIAFILQEALEEGMKINEIVNPGFITSLIHNIKAEPDLSSKHALYCFKIILETFQLVEILATDDDARADLIEIFNSSFCSSFYDSHLLANPLIKANVENSEDMSIQNSTDCSLIDLGILIKLMQVLATLKDHSKTHKELYWKLLKDSRLLPVIACALMRGTPELVCDALVLFTHCTQIHEFSIKTLSQHVVAFSRAMPSVPCQIKRSENDYEHEQSQSPHQKIKLAKTDLLISENKALLNKTQELEHQLDQQKAKLMAECQALESEKALLVEENHRDRELHSILRNKFDEMTKKFDTAAQVIIEKNTEMKKLEDNIAATLTRVSELQRKLEQLEETVVNQKKDIDEQDKTIKILKDDNEKLIGMRRAIFQIVSE